MGNAVGTAITAAGDRPAATADGFASAMTSEDAGAFASELHAGWNSLQWQTFLNVAIDR
jgi:hypothetical protein